MRKSIALFICVVISGILNAQNQSPVVKEVLPGYVMAAQAKLPKVIRETGSKDILWSEDFGSGIPAGWAIESAGDFCNWSYTTQGPQGAFSVGVPPIASSSADNGFIILDPDLCNISTPYQVVDAFIQTEKLNLEDFPNVRLEFQHNFRYCCDPVNSKLEVLVSNDSINWVAFDVKNGLGPNNTSANPLFQAVNISEVAGGQSSVWIRFHQSGTTHYWWMVDDIQLVSFISNDLAMDMVGAGGYSRLPYGQAPDLEMFARVTNVGGYTQTNVKTTIEVNKGFYSGTSTTFPQLGSGSSNTFSFSEWPELAGKGVYEFEFLVSQQEEDEIPENNIQSDFIWITDSVYARDSYNYNGMGIWNGAAQTFTVGNIFELTEPMAASSVSFVLHQNTQAGSQAIVRLYSFDGTTFTEIASSQPYSIQSADVPTGAGLDPISVSLPFTSGNQDLSAGIYLAGVELSGLGDYGIAASVQGIMPPETSYFYNGEVWSIETNTPMIRLNFGENVALCTPQIIQSVTNDVCNAGMGMAEVHATVGTPPFTYTWSTDPVQQGPVAIHLTDGTYQVNIIDEAGCEENFDIVIGNDPLMAELEIKNAACNSATGSAKVTPTNGTAPYSYLWNTVPPQIFNTAVGLLPGTYSVEVTDASECVNEFDVIIGSDANLTLITSSENALCGSSSGSATVVVDRGVEPYTYSWDTEPAQTTAKATGLAAGLYSVTVTDDAGCMASTSVSVGNSNLILAANMLVENASCGLNNGSIEINMINGQGPYTYLWDGGQTSPVIENLAPGIYGAEIMDANGCLGNASATVINVGNAPVIDDIVIVEPEGCGNSNGSVSIVMPSGDYTYLWSTGSDLSTIENIGSGIYTVAITSVGNNCQIEESIFVSDGGAPEIVASIEDVSCNGLNDGSISISLEGTVQNPTYLWSNGSQEQNISNLAAGWYHLTVTDESCVATGGYEIMEPELIRVIVTSYPSECFDNPNGSISLAVSGGVPPYTYLWGGGQTQSVIYSLSGGIYSVTITDSNECELTKEINLFAPQQIVVNPTITHTTPGLNQGSIALNVSGGAGGFTYEWSNGGTEASITGLGAGIYSVTITDANECQVYYQYTIGFVSVSELLAEESRIVVYPIPSSDVVFVDFIGQWPEKVKVELLNLEGQRLMNTEAELVSPNGKTKISTALLKPGVYILKVYTKDGYVTQKIIKS